MRLSTETIESQSLPVSSRSGRDFVADLVSQRLGTILIFVLIGVVVSWYLAGTHVRAFLSFLDANKSYLIAVMGGGVLHRLIYRRFRSSVVLRESDPLNGVYGCCRITKSRFARMKKVNGALRPRASVTGMELYFVRSVDFSRDEIDCGFIHDPDQNPDVLLTYESSINGLIESDYQKTVELGRLKRFGRVKVLEEGMEFADEILRPVDDMLRGGGP